MHRIPTEPRTKFFYNVRISAFNKHLYYEYDTMGWALGKGKWMFIYANISRKWGESFESEFDVFLYILYIFGI